eukprot:SAG11_NODE_5332_length_1593_cov_2.484605_2_plen_78_part_00
MTQLRAERIRPNRALLMGCAGSTAKVAPRNAAGGPLQAGGQLITPHKGVALLIIDPQNSFHGGGSLAVPGADEVHPL